MTEPATPPPPAAPSASGNRRPPVGEPPPLLPRGLPPLVLVVAYVLIGSLPLLVAEPQPGGFWRKLSSGLAMVAFALLCVQFALSSRLVVLTGRVGIDVLMRFHQRAAQAITVALVLHPLLYLVPALASDPARALTQLIAMFTDGAYASGVLAWVMLLALTVSAILRDWLPLPYEAWRFTHGLGAAALAIAGLHHALDIGSHSAEVTLAQLWIVMVALAFGAIVYLYIVKPWQLSQRPYYVSHVHRVGEGLWSVTLWPAKLQPIGILSRGLKAKITPALNFEAGQFVWVTIGATPFLLSDHPLSIASAPGDRPRFRFLVKEAGDFTKLIGRVPVGTRAYMDGPYGRLTLAAANAAMPAGQPPAGLAFIAGGVGVAPILSLLRERHAAGETRPMRLIYGNRAASQIVFGEELEAMAAARDFRVRHVLREPPYEWTGGVGVLDGAVLDAWIDWPEPQRWVYFLCGPPAMIDVAERALIARGVPPAQIIAERFRYQ